MRIKTWAIGAFILIGFVLFTAILFLIGDKQKAFSKHMEVYTEFANLGGLTNGAKVRVSGLDAGQIKKIEIPHHPSGKFKLELQLEEKARDMLRKDSVASIETEGVVGDKFVSVKKGTDQGQPLGPGDVLPSKEPFDMGALLERSGGLLDDIHGSITDIRGRVDVALDSITKTVNHADGLIEQVRPNINEIASRGAQITGQLNALVSDLNAGKGPAGLLLKDEATRQQIQGTLTNIRQASTNIDDVSKRADDVIADVQSRQLVAKMQNTLDHVQSLSEQLDVNVKQALAEDGTGQNGATNLRETLANLNRGTANLADDTEALKHNFLIRGFFKKRGYYHLDRMTRAEYIKMCAGQKDAAPRQWLEASSLVADDGNGEERLSDLGRQMIDSQLSPHLETLPEYVVVIEGYAQNGSPDQQFMRSRKRADLVRRYLEARYHFDRHNIGSIGLRNQPLEDAGKDHFDGAAIVLFSPAKTK
jgi:phospholipid/cholesterol/gamma-HCH transport system substrate-binding protein